MTLSDTNILSVIELAAYSPILLVTILVLFRVGLDNGFRIWTSLIILCLLRIVGSALELATISQPTNTALFKWSAILSSVGLSPLFLATIGVLILLDEGLDKIYKHPLGLSAKIHHTLLELATILSVVLILVGGIKGGKDLGKTHQFDIDGIFKAGVAVLIVIYAAFCDAGTFTFIYRHHGPLRNLELFSALYASLPFILVRLIYVCLAAYGHSKTFNLTSGNVWVRLAMTVIMEVCVAIMYLAAGLVGSFRRPRR